MNPQTTESRSPRTSGRTNVLQTGREMTNKDVEKCSVVSHWGN
jgi:hypothetical protein